MLRKLAESIREYKKETLLTPLLMVFEVVMECLIPFITADLVNAIKAGADMTTIAKYGALLVVMACFSLMFGAVAGNTCATASCGFAKNLRRDMYHRIQNFSFENIDKFSTSSLVTRLTTEGEIVQMAFMMLVRTAFRSPFMMIFAFFMAFYMGGSMAWVFAVVIPILGFGLFLIARKAMPILRKVFRKY
ncbi:MAG: ABC transporter ATP-binding protein, partial [Clostridia bacterium]|nr:ABC transporter ATP-binding protein [Clostridia bacterium]